MSGTQPKTTVSRKKEELSAAEMMASQRKFELSEELTEIMLGILEEKPFTSDELANILKVTKEQTVSWLQRLREAGKIELIWLKRSPHYPCYKSVKSLNSPVILKGSQIKVGGVAADAAKRQKEREKPMLDLMNHPKAKGWEKTQEKAHQKKVELEAAKSADLQKKQEFSTANGIVGQKKEEFATADEMVRQRTKEFAAANKIVRQRTEELAAANKTVWQKTAELATEEAFRQKTKEKVAAEVLAQHKELERDAAEETTLRKAKEQVAAEFAANLKERSKLQLVLLLRARVDKLDQQKAEEQAAAEKATLHKAAKLDENIPDNRALPLPSSSIPTKEQSSPLPSFTPSKDQSLSSSSSTPSKAQSSSRKSGCLRLLAVLLLLGLPGLCILFSLLGQLN